MNRPVDHPIAGLIEDAPPQGQMESVSVLRPERFARLLHHHKPAAFTAEVAYACQIWGGGGHPLVPVIHGRIPEPYVKALELEQVDYVTEAGEVQLPRQLRARGRLDYPMVAIAASRPRGEWGVTLEVPTLEETDPWRPVYEAVLGILPDQPDPELLKWVGISELEFDEILPTKFPRVKGSLDDLIARIQDRKTIFPRSLSLHALASGMMPDSGLIGASTGPLPQRNLERRMAGPNIVVIVSDGDVQDLALLWNLRGAHGFHRCMPIGVPAELVNKEAIHRLSEPDVAVMFGFKGGSVHLTSVSHDRAALAALAEGTRAEVVSYESLLSFGPAPGRHRSHVSSWVAGETQLNPLGDSDEEVLAVARSLRTRPSPVLDVKLRDYPLPADPTMRGEEFFGRFQAGAAQVTVSELGEGRTVNVRWPTSKLSLKAVCRTRGRPVPSVGARSRS